jgi:hypothetical protein
MTDKLERTWNEIVMACLKVVSCKLPGGYEENVENLSPSQVPFEYYSPIYTQVF